MTYRALPDSVYGFGYNEARDKPAGVMGVLCKGSEDVPAGAALDGILFESESLDQAIALATAWRNANPEKSAYVCDEQNRIVKIVWRTDFSKEKAAEAESARQWFRIGMTSVFVLSIVAASALMYFKPGRSVPVVIAAIAGLELAYVALVKLKIANEIESLHIAVILSVLVWIALATIKI